MKDLRQAEYAPAKSTPRSVLANGAPQDPMHFLIDRLKIKGVEKQMNLRKSWLLAAIALLCACCAIFAQSVSGDLAGTVFDASGATIPNATIVGKNDATGVETTTKSTATGEYHLSNLPPGTYTITVTASGFTKSQIRGVAVALNKTATTNVKLDVGTNVETVEVSASAATIDTTTASVQSSFSSSVHAGSAHRVGRQRRHQSLAAQRRRRHERRNRPGFRSVGWRTAAPQQQLHHRRHRQ